MDNNEIHESSPVQTIQESEDRPKFGLSEERPRLIAPKVEEKRVPRWKRAANVAARTVLGLFGLGAVNAAVPVGLNAVIPNEGNEIVVVAPQADSNKDAANQERWGNSSSSTSQPTSASGFDSLGRPIGGSLSSNNEFGKKTSQPTPPLEIHVPEEVSQNLHMNKNSFNQTAFHQPESSTSLDDSLESSAASDIPMQKISAAEQPDIAEGALGGSYGEDASGLGKNVSAENATVDGSEQKQLSESILDANPAGELGGSYGDDMSGLGKDIPAKEDSASDIQIPKQSLEQTGSAGGHLGGSYGDDTSGLGKVPAEKE